MNAAVDFIPHTPPTIVDARKAAERRLLAEGVMAARNSARLAIWRYKRLKQKLASIRGES